MADAELAWAAGYLEGEGSFLNRRVHTGHLQIQVCAASTDEDVIRRLQATVGGVVSGPYDRGHKPYWQWHLSTMKDAVALMESLRPMMGSRRQAQIDEALAAYAVKTEVANGDKTHCPRGHAYAGDNLYMTHGGRKRGCKACRAAASRKARESS